MKCIALSTVLALALPAAVYAEPVPARDTRTYVRDRDNDSYRHEHYDRYSDSHWASDVRGRWVTVARGNSTSGRREFWLGTKNRYHTFRVEALRGDPMISKIGIEFANGAMQVVDMNSALPAGAGEVIDLNGNNRRVQRIIVFADPHSRGTYAIYGT